jgi:formylglycine-generating enzyme required for sulfatase activity
MEYKGKNAQGYGEYKNNKDGSVMVLLPGGSFNMGSDNGDADEKPVHRVILDEFLIDKYEVTVAQFKAFCRDTGRTLRDQPGWNRESHPVVYVTWHDAKAYCDWAGERLPTEAEWEYAARGGWDGQKYVWGNSDTPPRGAGNFADETAKRKNSNWTAFVGYNDGYAETSPIGNFNPNGYGLYDMVGNVWEWCADWYDGDYYKNSPSRNPKGSGSGTGRVLRGGSWFDVPRILRVAIRGRNVPDYGNYDLGVRCARTP